MLCSHLQSVCRESSVRKTGRRRGQQGDLCVRGSDLADGAVMLPTPTGQVPGELPSFPPPLKLLLHLKHTTTLPCWVHASQGSRCIWRFRFYLSIHEAVENSDHKSLGDARPEGLHIEIMGFNSTVKNILAPIRFVLFVLNAMGINYSGPVWKVMPNSWQQHLVLLFKIILLTSCWQ